MYIKIVPIILIGTFFVSCAWAEDKFPALGEVSRGPVNVRAGANTNFEAVDKLSQGAEVVVLGKNYEWLKIQLPITAPVYVRADYVKEHDGLLGEMLGDKVNTRAKPNSESSTLGQLHKGEYVKLLAKANEWWKIEPPAGTVGYVHADFITVKSSEVEVKLRKPMIVDPNTPVVTEMAQPVVATPPVSVQGQLQPLSDASSSAKYQILVDGKTAYYVEDAPNLDHFNSSTVRVDGTVATEDKAAVCPILRIKNISLVL